MFTCFFCCFLQADGYEEQCRWCGVGGDLVGCDGCVSSFCQKCITRNLGKAHLKKVLSNDNWECYMCKPEDAAKAKWAPKSTKAAVRRAHTPSFLALPLNCLV